MLPTILPLLGTVLEIVNCESVLSFGRSFSDIVCCAKVATFQMCFHFEEQEITQPSQSYRVDVEGLECFFPAKRSQWSVTLTNLPTHLLMMYVNTDKFMHKVMITADQCKNMTTLKDWQTFKLKDPQKLISKIIILIEAACDLIFF